MFFQHEITIIFIIYKYIIYEIEQLKRAKIKQFYSKTAQIPRGLRKYPFFLLQKKFYVRIMCVYIERESYEKEQKTYQSCI